MQIGMAKVATSAEEARQFGILGPCDRVILNRDHLLAEAKREARYMADAGYVPPAPEKVYAAGSELLAALRVGIFMFKEGKYITEHDTVVAEPHGVLLGGQRTVVLANIDDHPPRNHFPGPAVVFI